MRIGQKFVKSANSQYNIKSKAYIIKNINQ